jgi:hypothetical protein
MDFKIKLVEVVRFTLVVLLAPERRIAVITLSKLVTEFGLEVGFGFDGLLPPI